MIRVFHAPRTRSLRVLWMCEEMGLPYEIVPVEFGKPKPAEFLAANPAGTFPAVVDGEVVVTESVAILQYLADHYGPTPLGVRAAEPGHPDYLQFLVLGEAGLGAPLNAVIGTRFFGPEDQKDNWTVGMVIEGFLRRLKLVERQLETRRYLAADRFTAADISVAYVLGMAANFLGLADRMPRITLDYLERVTDRPAFERASSK
jgi:glutathione S-transferase